MADNKLNVKAMREYISSAYSNARYGSGRLSTDLVRYYAEGSKSPSIAHLLFRDEFNKQTKLYQKSAASRQESTSDVVRYTYKAKKNIDNADRSDTVKPFFDEFVASWKEKYPRSKDKRRFLVEYDFIVWDKVKRKNWLNSKYKRFMYSRFLKTL